MGFGLPSKPTPMLAMALPLHSYTSGKLRVADDPVRPEVCDLDFQVVLATPNPTSSRNGAFQNLRLFLFSFTSAKFLTRQGRHHRAADCTNPRAE